MPLQGWKNVKKEREQTVNGRQTLDAPNHQLSAGLKKTQADAPGRSAVVLIRQ